jgi:Carboxypeptidase regulatory-like domain
MKGRVLRLVVAAAFAAAFSANWAHADNIYGSIRGTVTDPSGAVAGGVQVTATNVATGVDFKVTTKSNGIYEFLQLQAPGTYDVKAELTGFRIYQASGISLNLNQTYTLNITMEVGTVTQQVTVEAAATQVETTSMQLGADITGKSVVDLPLNGRNWIQLQQTIPGAVAASDRFTSNFATNGSRSQANGYLINGTDANDLPLNTPLDIPSPDAIGEVHIVTNSIDPEYGRNSGAVLNAVTKSGTNQFHGDGFEFYRDTSLNTPSFFQNTANAGPTIFHQNQFGGVLGGPIKKDKVFFFGSYQGTRARRPSVNGGGNTTVFTADQRNGSFPDIASSTVLSPTALVGDDGKTYAAGTPYSTVFSQGTIPTADFNPVAVNLLNKYVPLPNSPDGIDYVFNPITTTSTNQEMFRVDYNVSDRDSIFAYGFISRNPSQDGTPFTGGDLPGFAETGQSNIYQYTLGWNHTFGGSMLNEVRFGYNRFNFSTVYPVNVVQPSSLGFTGINPQFPQYASVPLVSLTGYFSLGFSTNGPQPRIDQTYQVTDNFSKIVGNHTFKMGFEMRRAQVYNPFAFENNGSFTFGGGGQYTTGDPGADFLLGFPDGYGQSSGNVIDARTREYYSYFQDQWKIRRDLTLTYGLGWQIDTPLTNSRNGGVAINCWRPGEQSSVFPTAPTGLVFPGDSNCSESGYHTHYKHFGPRLGFAYSLGASGKMSVRGGVGIYYNVPEEELTLQNLIIPPFAIIDSGVGAVGGTPSFAAPYTDLTGTLSIPNKYPFTAPTKGTSPDFSFFEPLSLNTIDPNFDIPSSYNYNLTFQRQLPQAMILSVGYVGLQGRHLENTLELNPAGQFPGVNPAAAADGCSPFALYYSGFCPSGPSSFRYSQNDGGLLTFGSIGQQQTDVNSNYNALQIEVNKRFTKGFQFDANYTWAHALDFGSSFENSQGFGGQAISQNPFAQYTNYGSSNFDARSRFVINYVYDLPAFSHNHGLVSRLTDGWEIAGITTFQAGFPLTLTDSSYNSLTCDIAVSFYGCWDRPNTIGPVQIGNPRNNSLTYSAKNKAPRLNYWFNPNSFKTETPGAVGNSGRNFFTGPGINNFDFSVLKNVHIDETRYFQLRFEFFNFFNHAQFGTPSTNVNSTNFGRITTVLSADPSRIIQLGAKFYF